LIFRSGLRQRLGRQVVVHTRDDRSIRGTLRALYRDSLILAAAQYLEGEDATALRGDVVVPRDNFSWWQEV
jgi:hypothetical protein